MNISVSFFSFLILLVFFEILRFVSIRFNLTWFLSVDDSYAFNLRSFARTFKEAYIKLFWEKMGRMGSENSKFKVIIWGAGKHTVMLHSIVTQAQVEGPEVIAVVNDGDEAAMNFWGKTTCPPQNIDFNEADAVLISSETFSEDIKSCCDRFISGKTRIIFPYDGLLLEVNNMSVIRNDGNDGTPVKD